MTEKKMNEPIWIEPILRWAWDNGVTLQMEHKAIFSNKIEEQPMIIFSKGDKRYKLQAPTLEELYQRVRADHVHIFMDLCLKPFQS